MADSKISDLSSLTSVAADDLIEIVDVSDTSMAASGTNKKMRKDALFTGMIGAWSEVTGTTQAMVVNTGYIANNAALVTLTLPATAALGSLLAVAGKGAGGWRIAQNSGQVIHFGNLDTTTGASGSIDSTLQRDVIYLICTTANTDFEVVGSVGNLNVL